MTDEFYLSIAGIVIRFHADFFLEIPKEMRPFLTDRRDAAERFELCTISAPMVFDVPPVYSSAQFYVYQTEKGCFKEYSSMRAEDGCCMVCQLCEDGNNFLFLPERELDRYRKNCTLSVFFCAEAVFMRHDCLLLHSSFVAYAGKAVLFCGASGIGKSTQAELWRDVLGAEILNGDRCVIARRDDGFYGCGSPYSGSSGITLSAEAPICALLLLAQSEENSLRRVSEAEAFRRIFRELTLNTWDRAFMERCLQLLSQLIEAVPIYELSCRPDREAVLLTKTEIMGNNDES